jgi:hypothetical protein
VLAYNRGACFTKLASRRRWKLNRCSSSTAWLGLQRRWLQLRVYSPFQRLLGIKRSMHIMAPRMHAVLLENRELRIRENQLFLFMLRFALGFISHNQLNQSLQSKLPAEELAALYSYMTGHSPRKRARALIIIFYLLGIPNGCYS